MKQMQNENAQKALNGHEAQLSELQAMLSDGHTNHVLTVEADRGMGKSHLLRKLAQLGEAQQQTVIEIDFSQANGLDTLYLIRRIRDQLEQRGTAADRANFDLLNKVINEQTQSRNLPAAIGINGEIQTVSVNLDQLRQNLLGLQIDQIETLSHDLNLDLPAGGMRLTESEADKQLMVDHLLTEAKRLDILADLVVQAQLENPALGWWDTSLESAAGRVVDAQGTLHVADLPARRLAIGEISRALFRTLAQMALTRQVLLLIDAWGEAGDESQRWLFHWLIKPLCQQKLKGVKLVVCGRDMTALRMNDLNASHSRLGPLSLSETRQLLVEKMGFSADSDIEEIHEWSGGIPSVITTLIAANQVEHE